MIAKVFSVISGKKNLILVLCKKYLVRVQTSKTAFIVFSYSVAQPSMWTKKEIVEFKDSIRKEGGDAIIKVGIT